MAGVTEPVEPVVTRRRPDPETRAARAKARRRIVDAANRHRAQRGAFKVGVKPFSLASLQRAVCVCRRRRLVSDRVLVAAGFRPSRRAKGVGRG